MNQTDHEAPNKPWMSNRRRCAVERLNERATFNLDPKARRPQRVTSLRTFCQKEITTVESLSNLSSSSEWADIYSFFEDQDYVYLGPVCHRADLPDAFTLLKQIAEDREDAIAGLLAGINHPNDLVVAYCAYGLRRLAAFTGITSPTDELAAALTELLTNVGERSEEVKCAHGSFRFSRTLGELATGRD